MIAALGLTLMLGGVLAIAIVWASAIDASARRRATRDVTPHLTEAMRRRGRQ